MLLSTKRLFEPGQLDYDSQDEQVQNLIKSYDM